MAVYRGDDASRAYARRAVARRAAASRAALFEKEKFLQQRVYYNPSMKPPSVAPSSCCPSTDGAQIAIPCKHIRQAAARKHLECVKHFWGLRSKGNPEEEYFEKYAVLAALMNGDVAILEYLLSRDCPWDPFLADGFFSHRQTSPWSEWHDRYNVAFKYKLPSPNVTWELLLKFIAEGRWDFLEKVHNYGYTFEAVRTICLAFGPDGANIAALQELLERKAFRTADLSWLTPSYAGKVNDLALLKFGCELRPEQVRAARAKVENPVMREWLDNHINSGKYPKARWI